MKCLCKIVASILCLSVFCILFSGCGKQTVLQKQNKYIVPDNHNVIADGIIAENDKYSLIWNSEFGCVSIKDKTNGYMWSTTPTNANDKGFDDFGFPIIASPAVNSPVTIQYINPSTLTTEVAYGYSSSISQKMYNCKLLKNGIEVTYYFNDEEIAIPVDYILRDDSLSISVNTKEIQQGRFELFSITLAPYLCYTENESDDSYIFVPSGCGALIYPKTLSQTGTKYSEPVYGEDSSMQVYDSISTTEQIYLPIYGSKNSNQGVLAIIENGAESSYIEGSIGAAGTGYSNIGTTFILRGYDSLIAKTATKKVKSTLYADSLISGIISLGVYPLSGSEANYNGMINKYRDYLLNTKQLDISKLNDSQIHIKILGGQVVKDFFFGVPYKKMFSLTSLNEAKRIVSEISDFANGNLSVELSGFGQSGLTDEKLAGGYTISSSLGNIKQLKQIQDLCNDKGFNLYFDYNLISFSKSGNGWSYSNDLAVGPTGLTTYKYQYYLSTRSRNSSIKKSGIISRDKIQDSATKLLDSIDDWGINGIGVGNLGSICYSDYSNLNYYVKSNMSSDIKSAINILKKDNKYNLLANSANVYAACIVDEITDVPLQSSNSDVFDIDIPAYQMLFCGYKSISSEPINSSVDSTEALLRAIEGGCGISYSVINNYDSSLISYTNNNLNSSLYTDVKDDIIYTIEKTAKFYDGIKGAKIKCNELLNSDLHKTVFDNGMTVYVNYGDKPIQTEVGMVEAKDYLVKESS